MAQPGLLRRIWRSQAARRRVYDILDDAGMHPHGRMLHRLLIALVLISVAAAVLVTVPSMKASFRPLFIGIEFVTCIVFTAEYLARLWSATEHPPWRGLPAWRARANQMVSPGGIVDLMAILQLYLSFFFEPDLGAFMLLRLMRFFKLARYSPGGRSIIEAISRERWALGACGMVIITLILLSATLMHLAEGQIQPDKLGTIPDAMYWAVVTLATLGYGDVVPLTPIGKVIASVTALFGLVSFAMPVGIVASTFAEAIQRREFVVTWSMVTRVPIFAEMAAAEIADVMRFLRAQTVKAHDIIVREGETAHSMYFITAGHVEIELAEGSVHLSEGEFFGELAILDGKRRSATVRATTDVRLLVLDAADFRSILLHHPGLAARVEHARARRAARAVSEDGGDLALSELTHVAARKGGDRAPRRAAGPRATRASRTDSTR